jgi:hypothetical protein
MEKLAGDQTGRCSLNAFRVVLLWTPKNIRLPMMSVGMAVLLVPVGTFLG